ncbi:lytic transglycosylase domain-containing protein [Rhizosaccharibacter radicis]|uniref:Lytic transglycosylase domain-containing protein n=1 Tax=Rhizosaccharibacter radicis TaxID=2782605 RepID=A0ABT1W1L4_9PROT|nr:lytic transglycosylase domain-containing protein [Acetobacteraceae bacterium KSS12]
MPRVHAQNRPSVAPLGPRRAAVMFLAGLVVLVCAPAIRARADDRQACQDAIAGAERQTGVPQQLLDAISRVESGRADRDTGTIRAWPWTINAAGQGHYYESRAEAVAAARAFQQQGIRSIDVGCMQINLMYHPDGFNSLEDAFDPVSNALYAARFLTDLFHQTGSWPHAAAAYHSQTPELGVDYQRKVLEAWAEPIDRPDDSAPPRQTGRRAVAHATQPSDTTEMASATPRPSAPGAPAHAFGGMGGLGRIIRLPGAMSGGMAGGGAGRGLAAYRLMPVVMAARPVSWRP